MSLSPTDSFSTYHRSDSLDGAEETKSEEGSSEEKSQESSSLGKCVYNFIEWSTVSAGGYLGNGVASIYGPGVVNNLAISYLGTGIVERMAAYALAGALVPYLGPLGCVVGGLTFGLALKGVTTLVTNTGILVVRVATPLFERKTSEKEFPHEESLLLLDRKNGVFHEAEDLLDGRLSECARIRLELNRKEI